MRGLLRRTNTDLPRAGAGPALAHDWVPAFAGKDGAWFERQRIRRKWVPAVVGLSGLLAVVVVADLLFPPPLEKAEVLSQVVLDHEGRWLHAFATPGGRWRFGADLEAIDPVFIERLVAVEDKRFWTHQGVDLLAVARAAKSAVSAGRFVSGASTITMQTARLLEPRPRTLGSKFIEMIRALQIERRLSKREILELYLTLAPYGGKIAGVRAASLLSFGKEPQRLTDAEQALLIALPQGPEARRPDRRPAAARAARAEILKEFADAGVISAALEAEANGAALPSARAPLPRAAYHAALALSRNARDEPIIRSSLDVVLQTQAEALARRYAANSTDGATTALLIIDNKTRAVRAAVGSSGLDAEGGWIDLTMALRSPGSTLKPFIYGMAFEDGLVAPSTVIEDMPQSFDGYAPENFDRTFRGEVRVSEALQHSLNLPAVRLLNTLGAQKLAALLRASGVAVAGPKRANHEFGLTLALGGAGVTMRDIGVLYAALADSGAVKPLVWLEPDAAAPDGDAAAGFHLFSAESAARINAILADAPALDGRVPSALSQKAPRVAYKTGTSYGYRDAWAAGHAGGYTVVAWVGRADGASRPGETGRKAAAPLLMDAFDMIARFDRDRGRAPQLEDDDDETMIARFAPPRRQSPPDIVFPRDGVELYSATSDESDRGFALAARGGAGRYRWYVDGDPVVEEATSGRAVWRPEARGFYQVTVVDAEGRSARAKVRVAVGG
jgi:penicillin-binding protein 1C